MNTCIRSININAPLTRSILRNNSRTNIIPFNGKYNVHCIYDTLYWAYYWQCIVLEKYQPSDFNITSGNDNYDFLKNVNCHLVLQMVHGSALNLRKRINSISRKTILVTIYSRGWNHSNELMTDCLDSSDHVVCNNYEMWDKYGRKPNTSSISNGVDCEKFYITVPLKERKTKVLWIGSIIHRTVKNYDSIIIPLSEKLKKDKIDFDFRLVDSRGPNRMNQDQMRDWYNTGTIYVVPSTTEGTPCPLLESSACGCIPVSTRVGNAPELIIDGFNGYLCDTNHESLYQGIKKAILNNEASNNIQNSIKSWHWKERSNQYYDLFKKLIDERK